MKRIFGLVFLLVGIGLLYFNVPKARQAYATKGWPTTSGTVEKSSVKSESAQSIKDAGDRSPTVLETYYKAAISYRYNVEGKEHTSDRLVRHEMSSRSSGGAVAATQRYPVGATVTVHYDPSSPDIAVLETNIGTMILALNAAGLLFTLMGMGGLLFSPINAPQTNP